MTKRGPTPKPTPILRLTNPRKARARDRVEPKAPTGEPIRAIEMSEGEVSIWDDMCSVLRAMDLLSVADGAAMARYCTLLIQWRAARAFVEKSGQTYPMRNSKNEIIQINTFPQVHLILSYGRALLDLEREFGLTPSARARMGIERLSNENKGAVKPHVRLTAE